MVIRRVVLRDFRSYRYAAVDMGPGITAFVGPNAVGKTNFLEAIHFAATGSSPRTARDTDLIRWGAAVCSVRLEWDDPVVGRRSVDIAYHRERGKGLRIDGQRRRRLTDLLGQLPVVYFAPETMALIKQGPSARRQFLDRMLGQLDRRYAVALQDYQRTVLQRNQLLRDIRAGRASPDLLAIWDEPLYERGSWIRRHRLRAVQQLEPLVQQAAIQLGICPPGAEAPVRLLYDAAGSEGVHSPPLDHGHQDQEGGTVNPGAGGALDVMPALRREEIHRGVTLWGPHRDDFRVLLADQDARSFASQGQQRGLVLALLLAEVELLRRSFRRAPVLLLDDVLSELDGQRRQRLLAAVSHCPQVLLTSTDEPDETGTAPIRKVRLPLDVHQPAAAGRRQDG